MSNDVLTMAVDRFLEAQGLTGSALCVALSGGRDSVALLHVLCQLRPRHALQVSACHVNHQLLPEAPQWVSFCETLCAAWQVPLTVTAVAVRRAGGESLEAKAREARYTALQAMRVDAVLLAQHADDQAETVLLQLLRGAGPRGLAAMPAWVPSRAELGPGTGAAHPAWGRPLLGVSRAEVDTYLQQHQLSWVDDPSNLDPAHARNALRHQVMPHLAAAFPQWRSHLAQSAAACAAASQALDEQAELDLAQVRVPGGPLMAEGLSMAGLQSLSPYRAQQVVRRCLLERTGSAPGQAQVAEWWRQACAARPDLAPHWTWRAWVVGRYQGVLRLDRRVELPPESSTTLTGPCRSRGALQRTALMSWPGVLAWRLVEGQGLDADRAAAASWRLSVRQGGETLRVHPRQPTRQLKQLFHEAGVPPWLRAAWPLAFVGAELVLVPGVALAADWQARPGESGWACDWLIADPV